MIRYMNVIEYKKVEFRKNKKNRHVCRLGLWFSALAHTETAILQ